MRKIYVLDTNVLLHDPQAPLKFEDNVVVIPAVVLFRAVTVVRPSSGPPSPAGPSARGRAAFAA